MILLLRDRSLEYTFTSTRNNEKNEREGFVRGKIRDCTSAREERKKG